MSFRHEAVFYAGEPAFAPVTLPFIQAAVAAGEPIVVAVGTHKIDLLRRHLGDDAASVIFADMESVGSNPARIIPAWHEFVDEHSVPGRTLRGIGEPIHPERSPVELTECERHECLLNLAFADTPDFWLACPYDTEALPPPVIAEAKRNHPLVGYGTVRRPSESYCGLEAATAPFDEPLPAPSGISVERLFSTHDLKLIRDSVQRAAASAGLPRSRGDDLAVAVTEAASNSVRHGGGHGLLRVWETDGALVCEVSDRGRIDRPLAGRECPQPGKVGGWGLWMANQLCDLVQLRTYPTGSVVRLHVRTA